MSKIKPDGYVVIQGWMLTELHLKGNELLIYATIYGFSQDEESQFKGSLQYLADWCNSSKESARLCVNNLVARGLLIKEEDTINGVKFCRYRAVKPDPQEDGIQESCTGIQESCMDHTRKLYGGIQESCINNIYNNTNNNTNNKSSIYTIVQDEFNTVCNRLSKINKITDRRKSSINARLKEYDLETILQVFKMANESDFLTGNNDRGWKADFDWLLKPNNFIKVLEGNYKNNTSTRQSYRLNNSVNYNTPRRNKE